MFAVIGTPVYYKFRVDWTVCLRLVGKRKFGGIPHFHNFQYFFISLIADGPQPVLSTCPLHTNSGCGKERRILTGP